MNSKDAQRLLDKLCSTMGFCLPLFEQERMVTNPPGNVKDFTDSVFVAEGFDLLTVDLHLYRQVREVIAEAFQQANDQESM
ncbi:MAG: hypothetical protein KDA54_09400 [Phycisphaerales bacterium]|nr:hypothetical protein [Phycisphaerales bacterium]